MGGELKRAVQEDVARIQCRLRDVAEGGLSRADPPQEEGALRLVHQTGSASLASECTPLAVGEGPFSAARADTLPVQVEEAAT